jgi:putative phosphoribosyl transferase
MTRIMEPSGSLAHTAAVNEGTMVDHFRDRTAAGQQLADALRHYRGRADLLVLGLPRGGVPVAYEVAEALGAPLDVLVVRKLPTPGQPELAMGAIGPGGICVLNDEVVAAHRLSQSAIQNAIIEETDALVRRNLRYRDHRPPIRVAGRTVIVVDDGLATGATMRAALAVLRAREPTRLIVAVPVAPVSTCRVLEHDADEVVCLLKVRWLLSISRWYDSFQPVEDDEVRALLRRAERDHRDAAIHHAGSAHGGHDHGDARAHPTRG